MKFSKPILAQSGLITLNVYNETTRTTLVVATIPASSVTIEATEHKIVTFSFPNETLTLFSSWYSISIDSYAFSDAAGLALYGGNF